MSTKVAIIDSGGANIASLVYALERIGKTAELTRDAAVIRAAEKVILPGVGAARDAMQRLRDALSNPYSAFALVCNCWLTPPRKRMWTAWVSSRVQ